MAKNDQILDFKVAMELSQDASLDTLKSKNWEPISREKCKKPVVSMGFRVSVGWVGVGVGGKNLPVTKHNWTSLNWPKLVLYIIRS